MSVLSTNSWQIFVEVLYYVLFAMCTKKHVNLRKRVWQMQESRFLIVGVGEVIC